MAFLNGVIFFYPLVTYKRVVSEAHLIIAPRDTHELYRLNICRVFYYH